jgi:cytochrome P450
VTRLDVEDPAFLEDPHWAFRRLRETPVVWDEAHGMWLVSGHAEVLAALTSPHTSVATAAARIRPALGQRAAHFEPLIAALSHFLTRTDPPDHTRLRNLVQQAFTNRAVEALEPAVRELTARLLDGLAKSSAVDVTGGAAREPGVDVAGGVAGAPAVDVTGGGARAPQVDVMSRLAVPLPITIITRMLGMPETDQARLKAWTDDLASVADNDPREDVLERAQRSLFALRDHVLAAVAERKRHPGPDLLSALIAAEDEGSRLEPDELFGMVQVLLIAGQETTTNLIGNALHALLGHPHALARLRAEPALMGSAVEECARWDTPVQVRTRVATAPVELGGQHVGAGQTLFLLLGAANRDPRAFPDADRFDIARTHNHHVAFGHGIHYCLGAALARQETRAALEGLLARWPDLTLTPGARPRRRPNFGLRGFTELRITLTPRPRTA